MASTKFTSELLDETKASAWGVKVIESWLGCLRSLLHSSSVVGFLGNSTALGVPIPGAANNVTL